MPTPWQTSTVRPRDRRSRSARTPANGTVQVSCLDESGRTQTMTCVLADRTSEGMGLIAPRRIPDGDHLRVELRTGTALYAEVRWCVPSQNGGFRVGLLITPDAASAPPPGSDKKTGPEVETDEDLYEILQVNPTADIETIHRVYRILAARYHPDHKETGDSKRFQKVVEAWKVIGDPEARASYDARAESRRADRWRVFESAQQTVGPDAERKKRQAMLTILYHERMRNPDGRGFSITELAPMMNCPPEHLEFTGWYLRESGQVVRGDNGRYRITVMGVNYVEEAPAGPASNLRQLPAASQ